jgi:polyhydroxybutyrate depolymerase
MQIRRIGIGLGLAAAGLMIGWMLMIGRGEARAQSECSGDASIYAVGLNEGALEFEGRRRTYLVYVPERYDPAQPTPLVLSLHGFASSARQQMEFSQWNRVADEHSFIVVYPQGAGTPPGWNSGGFRGRFAELFPRQDDVAFIRALLDHLSETLCIDPARVYANGLSNGAGMSSRLGCELADRIAAIGGVAGAYNPPETCEPGRPVPVIAFHGLDDPISPYEGAEADSALLLMPIEEWARAWAARNGCNLDPIIERVTENITRRTFSGCESNADVILYAIAGAGHTWPGGGRQLVFISGAVNREIDASAIMWDFFAAHPLR